MAAVKDNAGQDSLPQVLETGAAPTQEADPDVAFQLDDAQPDTKKSSSTPSFLTRWRRANPTLFWAGTAAVAVAVILAIVLGTYFGTKSSKSSDEQNSESTEKAVVTSDMQIHLGLTGVEGSSVVVMWSTKKDQPRDDIYVELQGEGDDKVTVRPQESLTYNHSGYFTHKALLSNLVAGKTYSFRVSVNNSALSPPKNFTAPLAAIEKAPSRAGDVWGFLAVGDIGVGPVAQSNIQRMAGENFSLYEFMMDVGDLAYAFGDDELWDTYMRMIEPIASTIPWMTCPGNHDVLPIDSGMELGEAMRARFYMPYNQSKSANANWYSFNHRIAHFTTLNTDDDYTPGSEQYKWIEADLQQANSAEARAIRPWLFVAMHKPMYGSFSTKNRGPDVPRGEPGNVIKNLEPLFLKYNVDIVLTGHDHAYERMYPVKNNGTVIESSYRNASSPIHLLVGMGGYIQIGSDPPTRMNYSAYRELTFGYTRVKFFNASTMLFEYIEVESGDVHDSVIISKNVSLKL